ncbi:TRAP transporter substrate-binding protein [Cuneatibacter sp. NSJ-177]|uniref:TRAP transporter substrate-binding protein n=1 Tax=Cuneatibacter sp. NSJ-177 TaxID=2931401 RepID=UPI001FD2E209|nr:TRAP transporter substrate-binding protein [Cuneatibacter sp. NSJ-177]MCJ7834960.1 TRAP transporter substrate-binding protein [Cuneatibacter sp. NSJ-177]
MKMKKAMMSLLLAGCLCFTACGSGSGSTTAAAGTTAGGNDAATTAAAEGTTAAPAADGENYHYIMGHGAAEKSIGDLYCLKFKELVEEKTGGVVTVDVYSGSQLGTYGEMMQSLQTGDIGGMIFQPSPAVSFVPELAVLDIPYAFLGCTQEQIDKVLNDSEFSKILYDSFDKSGYKVMSFAQAATFREVTSKKELKTAEDFKGLNIRTLENNNHIAFWKAVGANPTPVAFNELYLSLQQGLVDAQENPYDTALNAGFAEVQSYLVDTHHILYPNLFIVNKALYESMPAEVQAQFDEAAEEAKTYAENLMKESAETDKQALIDAGLTYIELPDSELQKMKDMGTETVEKLVREALGDATVDAFKNSLAQ